MKKYLAFKKLSIVTICLYIISYLIYSFIVFEFNNPFKWIINIPTYDNEVRAVLLGYWIIYYVVGYYIIYSEIKEKK